MDSFCARTLRILALIAILAAVAGCSSEKSNVKTVSIGIQSDVFTRKAYTAARERFERDHPGVKVKEFSVTGGNYYQKMQTMFVGNSEPDVMWMGLGFGDFAVKGVLEDLTPYIRSEPESFYSGLDNRAVKAYSRPDGQFGLPFGLDFQILYYNKDLFDKAGRPYPTSSWTRQDLLEAARALTLWDKKKKRQSVYGLVGGVSWASFGGRMISDDGLRVLVNSPEMAAFLPCVRGFVDKYEVSPRGETSAQLMGMSEVTMFASGRAAMAALENYHLPGIVTSTRVRWGMCVMPHMGGSERGVWASTSGFCMSKRSRNKKLAWELMKAYISPEFMKSYYPSTMPADINCMREVVSSDKRLPPEALDAITESLKYLYIQPRIKSVFEIESVWATATQKFWTHEITARDVLADAEKQMNKVLILQR